jgi:predicted enzyme related to lactoylglutathione lyase
MGDADLGTRRGAARAPARQARPPLPPDGGAVQVVLEQVRPAAGVAGDDDDAGLVGRFAGVSFSVEDAQRACDRLTALGVEIVGPPRRQPWGGTLAHIADPDHNVLTLVEYPPPA